ncbi:receptor-like protein kinase HERK 1 [Rutidosis leptorrhynchoides]|uniref:receptor-like protein kinase HERK 1 n=1 Tax=Rutidosis leptorrhynchoides TaxID=125765 RepID=UPI003A9A2389
MSILNGFAHLQIPLKDVQSATNNFLDESLIGQGGFGKIYKGKLFHHEQLIDIVARKLDGLGSKEFWRVISMLSSLRHQNLVHFVGFCYENNEMILVNKYEANGSLDRYIGDPITLTWMQRLQIRVGVARAISYIHYDEARDFSIVHRNVRSSKILLDDSWQPKLAGFELSMRSTKAGRDLYLFAQPCGMKGYVDPKYIESSSVTHKSDVYSFGVVLFEVLCGKRAFMETEGSGLMLSGLVKSHFENGTLDDTIA